MRGYINVVSLSCSGTTEESTSARSNATDGLDLLEQCKLLAKGVYGLPEAISNVHALETKLAAVNEDRSGLSALRQC